MLGTAGTISDTARTALSGFGNSRTGPPASYRRDNRRRLERTRFL